MSVLAQQMAERRQRILEAARAMIGERGYDAFTMRDLARTSRVTVPTVYNLVGGKQDVLLAAVEEQTRRFVSGIDRVESDGVPTRRVVAVVEAAVQELLRAPSYYRALVALLFTAEPAAPARAQVQRAMALQLGRGLDELAHAGELEDWADPQVLVERLLAHLAQTLMQWSSGQLGPEGLRAASLYDACLTLAACTRGESRSALQRLARQVQAEVRRGEPAPAVRASPRAHKGAP